MHLDNKEQILQTLLDAGCEEADIAELLDKLEAGDQEGCVCDLKKHRSGLLDDIHKEQQKLDCLDYFLYRLRRKEVHIGNK